MSTLHTNEPMQGLAQCHCATCDPIRMELAGEFLHSPNMRMIVCAICGNKRCPHAQDHRLACTNSNDAGQDGSTYGPTHAMFVPWPEVAAQAKGPASVRPTITINARQLRQALEFVNPDGLADEAQLETEVNIGWLPAMGEGSDAQPEGLNAWLTEYPEEGCYFLDPDAMPTSTMDYGNALHLRPEDVQDPASVQDTAPSEAARAESNARATRRANAEFAAACSSYRASLAGSGVADAAPLREGVTVGTPVGWQLVPLEPTREMLLAVDEEADDKYVARGRAVSAWVAMLAAAPIPQQAAPAKPVAQVESFTNGSYSRNYKLRWFDDVPEGAKLYAHPIPAVDAGITDERIAEIWRDLPSQGDPTGKKFAIAFARAILAEASHKKE